MVVTGVMTSTQLVCYTGTYSPFCFYQKLMIKTMWSRTTSIVIRAWADFPFPSTYHLVFCPSWTSFTQTYMVAQETYPVPCIFLHLYLVQTPCESKLKHSEQHQICSELVEQEDGLVNNSMDLFHNIDT